MTAACIIGVRGYSDSGKTTLIEKALPELKRLGLYVGVLKHAHHTLQMDLGGKDTDRFYNAGADFVFAHDHHQGFAKYPHGDAGVSLALSRFPAGLDLIIIEGHKDAAMPHIWLESGPGLTSDPAGKSEKKVLNCEDPGYINRFLEYIHAEMQKFQSERIVRAGLLVGGKSLRMGRSKALLEIGGETLVQRSFLILTDVSAQVLLLGSGDLPGALKEVDRLPDVPGPMGPMAGILSALRWAPESAWIISSVDMPLMKTEAWQWLLGQRRPGVWAVLPRIGPQSAAETAGALYEPMIHDYLETLLRKGIFKLQDIAIHPKVISPIIPDNLAHAWTNVNTIEEWKAAAAMEKELSGKDKK